ncbi:hypothetical protein Trydic_g20622 [Trypoxylus dichotomus]
MCPGILEVVLRLLTNDQTQSYELLFESRQNSYSQKIMASLVRCCSPRGYALKRDQLWIIVENLFIVKMSGVAGNHAVEVSPKRRKVIHEQAREIVWNVYNYFRERRHEGDILTIVSKATGISRSSVSRIAAEGRTMAPFETPKPAVKPSRKSTVGNFGEEAIRRIIHDFHVTHKRSPTIKDVYQEVKNIRELAFLGAKSSFRRLLLKLGYSWRNIADHRKVLMEKYEIRQLRCAYIRQINNYRTEGRPIIYIDETYIDARHTIPFEWVTESEKDKKCPTSKGKRLVVMHAGSDEGFLNGALLIFKSGQKGDNNHHDDMNFDNYKRWLETLLIPNLPAHSVLVIDNASHHNVLSVKHPTFTSCTAEMTLWLDSRNIAYDRNYTKAELCAVIKRNKPPYTQYEINAILARHGHTVLRLPPRHPELNPIERIWGIVKNRVALKNVTRKLEDVERIAREEFAMVTVDEWRSICADVRTIEQEYIVREHVIDELHEQFIINVNYDSDSDSVFGYSSDEND